jgi:hypothetical protein
VEVRWWEGLRLSMLKQDEHGDLRALNRRNVIPYVHGRMRVVLFKRWLFLSVALSGLPRSCLVLASTWTFYSSRSDSYNETQAPTGGPGTGKTQCSRANDVFNGVDTSCLVACHAALG